MLLPLLLGGYVIFYFYDQLSDDEKDQLFEAFGEANYLWIIVSLVCGLISHMSRAYRWRFLLEPLGYKPSYWNCYHSLMVGYLINYALPRAGEASRAGLLYRYEKVPFSKGFGTIIAERIIDLVMLGIIAAITLGLQLDKIDLFQQRIDQFNNGGGDGGSSYMIWYILGGIMVVGLLAFFLIKWVRNKVMGLVKGVYEGVMSVLSMKKKGAFLLHTLTIWGMYVAMFGLCFFSLEATSDIPAGGILAGFVAGTIGIVLVQGGIGVYPAFVGMILTVYLAPGSEDLIAVEALALGWIIWSSQTLMMIILGGISVFLLPRINAQKNTDHVTSPR